MDHDTGTPFGMSRKRSAILDSPPSLSWCDSSDDELCGETDRRIEPPRARKRRQPPPHVAASTAPKKSLRDLLGLTAADEYIEASAAVSAQAIAPDGPSTKLVQRNLNREDDRNSDSSGSSSSSSEDEPILPLSRAPSCAAIPAKHAQRGPLPHAETPQPIPRRSQILSSCDTDTDDEPEQALSLSTNGPGSMPPFTSKRLDTLIGSSEMSESEDEDEVALAVRAPVRTTKPSASANHFSPLSDLGQKPAFPVSPELRNVGPLELAPDAIVPAAINCFLRSYQRDGVRFLYRSYAEGRGALLGDDMGLGKTIQVIAFLSAIMSKTGREADADRRIEAERSDRQTVGYQRANAIWPTCLIICPSSVIDNWRHELDTWGYFEHQAFSGARAKDSLDAFRRGRLDILITSHETASLSIEQLRELDLSCVFIDEAHKLKNPHSQMTQAMQTFRCKARFALTGTAIQNSYRELYTLADWTNPGLLGTVKEWAAEIEEPLKRGQRRDAHPEQIADARTRAEKLVKKVLPIFFLRRTKALIADQLPRKYDKVVF